MFGAEAGTPVSKLTLLNLGSIVGLYLQQDRSPLHTRVVKCLFKRATDKAANLDTLCTYAE